MQGKRTVAGNDPKETKVRITPRGEDFPRWYTDVIAAAEMADNSPVKGCMVIRPWGYATWEILQQTLDGMLKRSGHRNAYFPLFIPVIAGVKSDSEKFTGALRTYAIEAMMQDKKAL